MSVPILDSITGAVAAWSTGRKLSSAFSSAPATTAAGAYTLVRDQVGTRDAAASGSPAIGNGTINGLGYAKFDGANDCFTFTALALGSGDWTIFLAVGFSGTPAGTLVGRSSSNTAIRHASLTSFSLQSDSAGPASAGTSWVIAKGFHILRIARDGTAGTVQIYQNGEAVGGGAAHALAGSFTFDRFGVQGTSQFWSNMGFGECIVFPRLMSTSDAAQVEADMGAAWRSALFIDATGGNDANTGWEPGSALQTIGAARGMDLRNGSRVVLKCGETWRRDPLLFNRSYQAGTADAPIIIDQYGTGDKPLLIGSTQVTGPYGNVGGQEYKVAVVLNNIKGVWAYDGSGAITRLVAGTAGALAAGQYAYAGGELHFNVGGNPGAYIFECAQQDSALPDIDGCRPARSHMRVSNIHLMHWPEDGFKFDHDDCRATDILSEWNGNDGIGGGALDLYLGQSVSRYNGGKGRAVSGAAGDGVSLHGNTTITIEDVTCLYNDKAGIDHQETVTATMRNCWLEGNNQNITSASLTGTPGTQIWENCVVVRRPGDHPVACQFLRTTAHAVRALTVVNLDSPASTSALYVNSTGSVTIQNTITDGFHTGVLFSSGTLQHDHNLHNDTTAYSGVSPGANDVIGDPLFTDRANADFTLQAASPAIGAGADLGLSIDYLHRPRPAGLPQDIGAFIGPATPPPTLILDQVTGALAAWSTGRTLTSAFTLAPADLTGGVYSLIRDQVGTRDATAAGAPVAGTGSGLAYAQLDGVNDKFGFSALALGAGDWTACLALKFQGTAGGPFIGRTATTTGIRQSTVTNIDLRSDSNGPQPYNLAAIPAGFHILRIARDGTAGTIQIYLDGTAIGNGLPRSIAGNFTFDQLGAQRTSDAWANVGIGEVILFGRLLSSADIAAIEQDMNTAWI
jgi:hypothetical protein